MNYKCTNEHVQLLQETNHPSSTLWAKVLPWTLASRHKSNLKSKHLKNDDSISREIRLVYREILRFKCLCMSVYIYICTH